MHNPALAQLQPNPFSPGLDHHWTRRHKQRKSASNMVHLPWSGVSLRSDIAASFTLGEVKRPPAYIWLLASAALLLHAGFGWYLHTHAADRISKPKPVEIALQFERAKPPEPKIEQPKIEPKQLPTKQAQAVPLIQTATPEPATAAAVVSAEPPIAIAPTVSAPPAESSPAPVTAPMGGAGYLNNPPPEYPAVASRQGWQGTVILHVHVLATGKPDVVEVQKSSGRKVLDDEAVRTVKNLWSYTPAKRGDTAIDGWTTTPIEFQISS